MISVVTCLDLKCDFQRSRTFNDCDVLKLTITSEGEEITSVNNATTPTEYESLGITGQSVFYLPKGLGFFFPKIKSFFVNFSKLKKITKTDLAHFPELERIHLSENYLKELDGDLFEKNQKLREIDLSFNKNLKHIGHDFLNGLVDLKYASFVNSSCIDFQAQNDECSFSELKQRLQKQCPPNSKLGKLNDRIEDVQTNNMELTYESKILESEIKELKYEIVKLKVKKDEENLKLDLITNITNY